MATNESGETDDFAEAVDDDTGGGGGGEGGSSGFDQGVESGDDGDFRTGFEETVRRRERAEELEEQALQQYDYLSEEDVAVEERDGEFVPVFSDEAREEIQLREAADEIDEEIPERDITREDVEQTDDGVQLRDDVRRELAADEIDADIPGVSIGPGDLTESGDSYELREGVQRDVIREQFASEYDSVTKEDIVGVERNDGEYDIQLTEEAEQELYVERLVDEDDDLDRSDVEGVEEVTQEELEEQARESWQAGDIDSAELKDRLEDIRNTDTSFRPVLTDEAARERFVDRLVEEDDLIDREDIEDIDQLSREDLIDEAERLWAEGEIDLSTLKSRLDEAESIDQPRFRPEFDPETEADILERRLLDDEDITEEDLRGVETIEDESDIVSLFEEGVIDSGDVKELQQRVQDSEETVVEPLFAPGFEREQALESIVEADDDLEREDIEDLEQLSRDQLLENLEAQFRAGELSGSDLRTRISSIRSDFAPGERTFRPVFTPETRAERLEEQLLEDEDITEEDLRGVGAIESEEDVLALFEEGVIDSGDVRELQGRLEQTDEPIVQPFFSDDFERERAIDQLVEADDDLDREDIEDVEQLSRDDLLAQLQAQFRAGNIEGDELRSRISSIRTGFAPGERTFQPVLTPDARADRLEDQLLEDEDITEEDLRNVVAVESEEDVQQLFEEGIIDSRDVRQLNEQLEGTDDGALVQPLFSEEYNREEAAESIDDEIDEVDITADDVVRDGAQFALDEDTEAELAARDLDDEIDEVDITVDDIVRDGSEFTLAEETQAELAARNLDEDLEDYDVGVDDITRTDDGFELRTGSLIGFRLGDANAEIQDALDERGADSVSDLPLDDLAEIVDDELERLPVDERDIKRTDDGVELTEEAREQYGRLIDRPAPYSTATPSQRERLAESIGQIATRKRLESQFDGLDISNEDIDFTESGQLDLDSDVEADIAALQFDEQLEGVDVSADDIQQTDEGFELTEDAQREVAALRFDEQFWQTTITADDLEQIDGQFVPSERVQQEISSETARSQTSQNLQRQIAAQQFDDLFSGVESEGAGAITQVERGQTLPDADVTAEDITFTGDGEAVLSDAFQAEIARREAAERLDAQTQVAVTPGNIQRTDDGFVLDEDTAELEQRAQIAEEVGAPSVADVQLDDGAVEFSDRFEGELRDRQLEAAAENLQRQFELGDIDRQDSGADADGVSSRPGAEAAVERAPVDISADDLEFVDDGEIALTSEAEERVVGALVADETGMVEGEDFEVRRSSADARLFNEADAELPVSVELLNDRAAPEPAETEADDEPNNLTGAIALGLAEIEDRAADLPGAGAVGGGAQFVGSGLLSAGGAVRDFVSPVTGPVVDASEGARDFTNERVINPAFDAVEPSDEDSGLRIVTEAGRGAALFASDLTIGAPAAASSAIDTTSDVSQFAGQQIAEEGVVRGTQEVIQTGGDVGEAVGEAAVEEFEEDPIGTSGRALGNIGASVAVGAVAGRGLGSAVRRSKDRIRTLGSTKLDAGDLTQRDVLETVESGGSAFPGAQNKQLYKTDPPEAVRRQAEDMTPPELSRQFDAEGVDGSTLFKAIDADPDGPGPAGFRTREGSYESPGAFVGPELSPQFLRVSAQDRGFSFRPGFPDVRANSPTAVAIRTDVESPDASTLDEFNRELLSRAGETTARTKPVRDVNPGEIEAVIPPSAEFADVGTGVVRNTLRRIGVGSDFSTTIGGRRVPIRTVAPESELDSGSGIGLRALLDEDRAQFGGRARTPRRVRRDIDEIGSVRRPVDRPLPLSRAPRSSEQARTGGSLESSPTVNDASRTRSVTGADSSAVSSILARRRSPVAGKDIVSGPSTVAESSPVDGQSGGRSDLAPIDARPTPAQSSPDTTRQAPPQLSSGAGLTEGRDITAPDSSLSAPSSTSDGVRRAQSLPTVSEPAASTGGPSLPSSLSPPSRGGQAGESGLGDLFSEPSSPTSPGSETTSSPPSPGSTPSPPTPGSAPTPTSSAPRAPTLDIPELDEDDNELQPLFGGERKGIFTDFVNPLTGEEQETERDEINPDPDDPIFLGFGLEDEV